LDLFPPEPSTCSSSPGIPLKMFLDIKLYAVAVLMALAAASVSGLDPICPPYSDAPWYEDPGFAPFTWYVISPFMMPNILIYHKTMLTPHLGVNLEM
jgi:hypothetical protein